MTRGRRLVQSIIVETGLGKGAGEYGNVGDISMLQVAVSRLQELFPQARIQVLTDSEENLARYCPAAKPLKNRGRVLWFGNGVLLGSRRNVVPEWLVDSFVWLKRAIRSRFPNLFKRILLWRLRSQNRPEEAQAIADFVSAMKKADLFVMCGAGGFYDGCRPWNMDILDLLEAAIQRKRPAVMLGQGFGPISDPPVLRRATEVLPKVDLITLRGGRGASALLRGLGVAESKMETTGDEALELAYRSRSAQGGQGLGINMRFAGSAGTDEQDVERIGLVIQQFARQHNTPLIPVPIAMHALLRDDLAIKRLLVGFDETTAGGRDLDSPIKVIKQIALCRVVVTGAYHAAVFALAQGIPVVALAKSDYFAGKMLGLEDQFGEGCQTVLLHEPNVEKNLQSAIEKVWESADKMREPLLEATLRQIAATERSYKHIAALATGTSIRNSRRYGYREE
jgi:polysaccharide pyruvyl transferase WcaK-like protein